MSRAESPVHRSRTKLRLCCVGAPRRRQLARQVAAFPSCRAWGYRPAECPALYILGGEWTGASALSTHRSSSSPPPPSGHPPLRFALLCPCSLSCWASIFAFWTANARTGLRPPHCRLCRAEALTVESSLQTRSSVEDLPYLPALRRRHLPGVKLTCNRIATRVAGRCPATRQFARQ